MFSPFQALRIIFVGLVMTIGGVGILLLANGKQDDDIRSVAWPLLIAGPAVVVFGTASWPRRPTNSDN